MTRLSSIPLHVLVRVYGTLVSAAPDPEAAPDVVDRAEAALGADDHCPFCSVTISVPAAKACADVGDLDHARRHLAAAERSALHWRGDGVAGALVEVSAAHLAAATGDQSPPPATGPRRRRCSRRPGNPMTRDGVPSAAV